MNICECGCKQQCKNRFVNGHNGRGMHANLGSKYLQRTKQQMIAFRQEIHTCLCGCGKVVKNQFVHGHNGKGKHANLGKSHIGAHKGLKRSEHPELNFGGRPTTIIRPKKNLSKLIKPKKNLPKLGFIPKSGDWEHPYRWIKANRLVRSPRPRTGFLHSEETKALMSASHTKTYEERGDEILEKRMLTSGWKRFPYICIDGIIIKMRSNWERLCAKHLDESGIVWKYEPKGFLLSNGHRYFPDFYLPESDEWIEIKGYMSSAAQEKINLFIKNYPHEKLMLVRDISKFVEI